MSGIATPETFPRMPGMSLLGRRYALPIMQGSGPVLAVNGRLPVESGTTYNSYIRVRCTSESDPTQT